MLSTLLFGTNGARFFSPRWAPFANSVYNMLRRYQPLYRIDEDLWLVTRYADAKTILQDPRFSQSDQWATVEPQITELEYNPVNSILFLDPPHHTRLRSLVQKAFVPRRIRGLEPIIRDMVNQLLDQAAPHGHLDVIADLARPIPVRVICVLLGIPDTDHDRLQELAQWVSLSLDMPYLNDGQKNAVWEAGGKIREYFDTLVNARRTHLGDDFLSEMIRAESDGICMTQQELISMTELMFVAGHETTLNLIGNGLHTILKTPGVADRLAESPGFIPGAIEECLRLAPPVALNSRCASQPLPLGDKVIARGAEVLFPTDAVNRDPMRFNNPNKFDIERKDNAHLTFSAGPHFCLGAALARMEARIVFEQLFGRFSRLELLEKPTYRPHIVLRGFTAVKIGFDVADVRDVA